MKRTASKKNIEDFMTKNPNVKENINKVVNEYFLTDDLIIDGELPYENIIKDLVRNYETVSEGDILKYLLDKTENKTRLYRINIDEKNEYYIGKLRTVTDEILEELNNDTTGKTIKLSDRIDMNSEMINAICNFVNNNFNNDGFNAYEDCVEAVYGKNVSHILYMGKFIRTFIVENNLIWEKDGMRLYRPERIKINFHCYGCNNNSDVLFTKQDHQFSHSTMKYDFEEGYISDAQQIVQRQTHTKNNNGGGCLGAIAILISIFALSICLLYN